MPPAVGSPMRSIRRHLLEAGLLFGALLGCAGAPPPSLRAVDLEVRESKYDVRPFVKALVDGHPATLLLDTGMFTNALSATFARRYDLTPELEANKERIIDGNGQLATVRKLFGVPVQFGGENQDGTLDFLITRDLGADGILHPQELIVAGSALVFDFRSRKLYQQPEVEVVERLSNAPGGLRKIDYHGCTGEAFTTQGHRVVEVIINGVKTQMVLDTGSAGTVLSRNNPALKSMLAVNGRRGAMRAIASDGLALAVEDIPVDFAGASFSSRVTISPSSSICGDGALGADLLQHCTMVWGRKSLWVTCEGTAPSK